MMPSPPPMLVRTVSSCRTMAGGSWAACRRPHGHCRRSPIADAVLGRLTILTDGSVRFGLDVVRLLALGADGVLIGRAWVYALAAWSEAGVTRMLKLMEVETRVTMALTSCTNIAAIVRDMLVEGAADVMSSLVPRHGRTAKPAYRSHTVLIDNGAHFADATGDG